VTPDELKGLIRSIADFPKPGILFRDITTLIGHGEGFAAAVAQLTDRVGTAGADAIAGIEARGFIFGAAVASALRLPFLPIRKPGKLPVPVLAIDYALEYGTDTLELDPDAVPAGGKVALIDDLIATGGTAAAATDLLVRAGARIEQALFVIDLPDLGGADRLRRKGLSVETLMDFPGH